MHANSFWVSQFSLLLWTSLIYCQFHPFENGPGRVSYDQLTADVGDRASLTIDSLSINEAAISFLFKVKIYPFKKLVHHGKRNANGEARFGGPVTGVGQGKEDNGVVGAGVDFGLPNGSGFGYGRESPIKTLSFSRISFVSK